MFANGPGNWGSIPGRIIPKTLKMVLDTSLLNTQQYKVRIQGKMEPSRKGVAPFPTPQCSSYRKGSLLVALDYGRQLYVLFYNAKYRIEYWILHRVMTAYSILNRTQYYTMLLCTSNFCLNDLYITIPSHVTPFQQLFVAWRSVFDHTGQYRHILIT